MIGAGGTFGGDGERGDRVAFAPNGDVRIYYETFGSSAAPALLMVNGLGRQCVSYRPELCRRFVSAGYFVIRYDNRDVGLSTMFAETAPDVAGVQRALTAGLPAPVPYKLSEMASDGLAVLDELGIERAFDPAGTARQLMAIMASGSRTKGLASVSVPTLVLHGDADTLIDPSGGRRTAETVPGPRFVLLEGMGHDYPPRYWDQLVDLVTAHAAAAPA